MESVPEVENIDYKLIANQYITNINIIENDFQTNRNPIPTEFDQATIDYYAGLLGYATGEITEEMVNEIIEKFDLAQTEGLETLLEQYGLEQFVKDMIVQISNGNTIDDLSLIPDYLLLNQNEKDLIALANSITQSEINSGRACELGGGTGALIGGLLCGACIVVGAVLFGSLGCGLDGGK